MKKIFAILFLISSFVFAQGLPVRPVLSAGNGTNERFFKIGKLADYIAWNATKHRYFHVDSTVTPHDTIWVGGNKIFGDSLNVGSGKFIINRYGQIIKWGNKIINDIPSTDSTKVLFSNGKWKIPIASADTLINYHWMGLNRFQKKVEFIDDSLKINGLWYIFPSTRIANSFLYDSLGNGILKNKPISSLSTDSTKFATRYYTEQTYKQKNDSTALTGYATRYALSLKQNQLNGMGFVKANGTTISFDNSTYSLSTHTQSENYGGFGADVSVISAGLLKKSASNTYTSITDNSSNWNTAYGWGNWASNFGSIAGTITQGNDPRLSDARTPLTHGNEKHSATYITLSSLSGTTPISYNSVTGAISITQAGSAANGYLSSTDWNTFNNKQPAGSYITLVSLSGTSPINYNSGTGAISINQSNTTTNGYLSSTDWNTFNGKLSGNQTITLGGILSGSGATSITASAATGYYMPTTTDQSNWNSKESALTFNYPLSRSVNAVSLGYNTTNLQLTTNQLNTIQDITTTSTPTFGGLTINGNSNAQSIYPLLTDTYDLGSFTKYWSNAYISQLQATIFAENTISAVGGYMYISKGQGLLSAVASGTTQIDFGQTMTVGDIIIIKSKDTGGAYKTEYMSIVSLVSGTTYNVTRDLAGAHVTDPAWADGTVFVTLGQNGNGRLELNAYDTPRFSVIKQGATYNAQTEYIRLGDLNGFLGYNTETYGIGIGEATKYLKYDPTNGLRIAGTVSIADGSAGGWTIDATKIYSTNAHLNGSGYISFGATPPTTYGNNVGAWLGYSGGAKLSLYSDASNYMQWSGSALSVGGGSITGATITGGTIQTATSGQRVVINESGNTNSIKFYDSGGMSRGSISALAALTTLDISAPSIFLDGTTWVGGVGPDIALKFANNVITFYYGIAQQGDLTASSSGLTWKANTLATQPWITDGSNTTGLKIGTLFDINASGNITKINNITYSFPSVAPVSNQVLTCTNATGGILGWTTPSTGITSLNTLTAASQSFAIGTAGTAPAWSSVTATHTLNIPMASVATVTAGLISKTDYDTFNGKQATITGAASTVTTTDLTASRILVSDANGKVAASGTGSGYLFSAGMFDPAYGSLVETSGSTAMTMTGSYVKWASSNLGISGGTTLSTANDRITINADHGGVFRISYSVTYNQNQAGSPNVYWCMGIDGVTGYAETINASPQSENHTASSELLVSLTAGQYIELFSLASAGTVTPTRVQLNVQKISN